MPWTENNIFESSLFEDRTTEMTEAYFASLTALQKKKYGIIRNLLSDSMTKQANRRKMQCQVR